MNLMDRMVSNPGGGCGKNVGRGIIAWPCRVDGPNHDGPCAAPEDPASTRARQQWETDRDYAASQAAQAEADIRSAEQARQVEQAAYGPPSAIQGHSMIPPNDHRVPTKQRPGDQRLPSGGGDCVQERIIADMQESMRVGVERYGQVLRTFNGRKGFQDLFDEVRDLHVYTTMIAMEAEATGDDLVAVVEAALDEWDDSELTSRQMAERIVDLLGGWVLANRLRGQES